MNSSILEGKKVLVVDDYEINTEVISLAVGETGAVPLTASNGQECVDIVKNQEVDIILMDRHMPVMDGIEATKAVRTLPQGKKILIIGISGSDDGNEAHLCIEAGMDLICDKLDICSEKLTSMAAQFWGQSQDAGEIPETDNKTVIANPPDVDGIQSPIDYEKAIKEFENDKGLVDSLIREFSRNIASSLLLMEQALEKSDFELIRNESHGIKGGAANLCAAALSGAAKQLESACRQNADKSEISEKIEKLKGEINAFVLYVNNMLPSEQ